jgi:hypothetical protein
LTGRFETSSSVHQMLEVKPVPCRAAVIRSAGSCGSMRPTTQSVSSRSGSPSTWSDPGSSWMSSSAFAKAAASAAPFYATLAEGLVSRLDAPSSELS